MAQLLCHSAILLMFVFSTKGNLQWLLFVKWWGPGTVLLTVMVHPFVDQPFAYSWPFQYRKYNGRSLHFVFLTLLPILPELLRPGLRAPRLHAPHAWIPPILTVMARFSPFRSAHNHCCEHFAEVLFAHSFRIETRAWGPPVTDRETTTICVQMMTSLRRHLPPL